MSRLRIGRHKTRSRPEGLSDDALANLNRELAEIQKRRRPQPEPVTPTTPRRVVIAEETP